MKYIIFDLDGTLVDSSRMIFECSNAVLESMGRPQVSHEDFEAMRSMPPRQALKVMGVSIYQIPGLKKKVNLEMYRRIDQISLFSGVLQLLEGLKADGFKMSVLSSNQQNYIDEIIARDGLGRFFDKIESSSGLFGKLKDIRSLVKELGLEKSEVIYVGDELRDVEGAKGAGVNMLAVTWGIQDPAAMRASEADWVVDDVEQLEEIIRSA